MTQEEAARLRHPITDPGDLAGYIEAMFLDPDFSQDAFHSVAFETAELRTIIATLRIAAALRPGP